MQAVSLAAKIDGNLATRPGLDCLLHDLRIAHQRDRSTLDLVGKEEPHQLHAVSRSACPWVVSNIDQDQRPTRCTIKIVIQIDCGDEIGGVFEGCHPAQEAVTQRPGLCG